MQDSPRSLTIAMSIGGIVLLFILGAILAVTITEAMVVSVDRDLAPAPVAAVAENAEPAADAEAAEAPAAEAPAAEAPAAEAPAAEEAAAEDAAAEENTAEESTADTAEAAPEAAEAAAPAEIVPVPVTDELVAAFTKGTCIACHVIPEIQGAVGMVGPDLTHIGTDAATRVPGQSAVDYIHESIVNPLAFIAPECPFGACAPGAMPAGLDQMVSAEELDLMVNYLAGLE